MRLSVFRLPCEADDVMMMTRSDESAVGRDAYAVSRTDGGVVRGINIKRATRVPEAEVVDHIYL